MRIYLYGQMNMPDEGMMVNCLRMKSQSGVEVLIDRDFTGYNIDEYGRFGMTWLGTYLWDSDAGEAYYLTEADMKYLKDYTFLELEIEDDAPTDYSLIVNRIEDEEYGVVFERQGELNENSCND